MFNLVTTHRPWPEKTSISSASLQMRLLSTLKSDNEFIFWPGRVGAGRFVPPGVPSPVSRFFPTTAPGLKFGDKEFGPRRKNYLHFPLNGAGIRRGIKPTGGRIKRQLVGGMERMHKFHNGHLSLGRVRDWAVGGGPTPCLSAPK